MNFSIIQGNEIPQFRVMSQSPGQRECNWTVRCPFFKNLQIVQKKNCISITFSELLNYKKFQKQ